PRFNKMMMRQRVKEAERVLQMIYSSYSRYAIEHDMTRDDAPFNLSRDALDTEISHSTDFTVYPFVRNPEKYSNPNPYLTYAWYVLPEANLLLLIHESGEVSCYEFSGKICYKLPYREFMTVLNE
ncbi:MAG: hypothetical protein ACLFPX_07845, partial [Candidatus Omnitrophota bacterium]